MIEVKNVTKTYTISGQKLHAAIDVSFTVNNGEMISIVGHSGSGKTTLLSLIGGLTKPDAGDILVDNVNLWTMSDGSLCEFRNKKMSFIYQFASLIPTLTALENILLPTAFGDYADDVEQTALNLLETVGLADKNGFYPSQLSGGQQRRVAIARAFINSPEIVLADEPTGDLDEDTEREIVQLFKKMNTERNTTFVIVTHNSEIARQTSRQLRIKDGRLQKE